MSPDPNADLSSAVKYFQQGNAAAAARQFRSVLAADPANVDALHFYGLLLYSQGERDRGIRLIKRALRIKPDYADAVNNLGNVMRIESRLDEARELYEQCLELRPGSVEAHLNLAVLNHGSGRLEEAEPHYCAVLEADPENLQVCELLVRMLRQQGRYGESIIVAEHALKLRGDAGEQSNLLYRQRTNLLMTLERFDEAIEVYEQWLAFDPGNPLPTHMLTALRDESAPERASDDYVRDLFDGFAASFDTVLNMLEYRAPQLIGEAVDKLAGESGAELVILDAGCGTGLCGSYLEKYASRLVGVDLSPGMLSRAQLTGHYDELLAAEITAFLAANSAEFDLIASADTLCYFGRLDEVVAAAAISLRSGGRLIFTIEAHDDDDDFTLHQHGRYSHRMEYVDSALREAGFTDTTMTKHVLRHERGEQVHGYLVSGSKSAS